MKSPLWNGALLVCVATSVAACAPGTIGARPPERAPAPAPPSPTASRRARSGPALAERRPVAREYFGQKVVDDYAWLEDDKDPAVSAFTEAQSSYARRELDALPDRAKIRARLAELKKTVSSSFRSLKSEGGVLFAIEDDGNRQQSPLVVLPADADPKSARTVVDPNVLDPSGHTTIDWFVPSPDDKLVAVSLSKGGTESGDVHVFDVATGKETGDVVARVQGGTAGGSLAWNADGSGFYYTRYPRTGERPDADLDFYQEIWFHSLGAPAERDAYSLGKEFPRIAEAELVRSVDGKAVLAIVSNGDGGKYEHHVLVSGQGAKWRRLSRFEDRLSTAAFGPDGKLYVVSRKDAPRGKVLAFAPPYDQPPAEVAPEGDAVVERVVATKSALYLVEVVGGPSRVRRVPFADKAEPLAQEPPSRPRSKRRGKKRSAPAPKPAPPVTIAPGERGPVAAELPLPPVSNVSAVVRSGEDLLLRVESFVAPPAWFRYRASEHRIVPTPLATKLSFETGDLEVVRETCTSKDGTKVPMTILGKRDRRRDGSAPTLITGYGGFGISRKPHLRPFYRAIFDVGGVVVETNLRGGGERGESWHEAGMLEKKQNVFDDFAACAERLFELGVTRPERLAAWGRSNGGLLMGAALTQHPETFRAVVAGVGIYDMLRSEETNNGQFNVTEYGTVKDERQFRALYAYSPLHHVTDGVAYPAVLFMTGKNDPRVDPFHSRKMVARLQAATSSDRPILLRTSGDTGHGAGTPLSAALDETADMLVFLFHELGVAFP